MLKVLRWPRPSDVTAARARSKATPGPPNPGSSASSRQYTAGVRLDLSSIGVNGKGPWARATPHPEGLCRDRLCGRNWCCRAGCFICIQVHPERRLEDRVTIPGRSPGGPDGRR